MKCIITGGAGFIGSHLADRLLAEGHALTLIDNLLTGSKRNIAHLLSHPRVNFIQYDCSTPLPPDVTADVFFPFS